MDREFKEKMMAVCKTKIATKGDAVGLSFYVFFKNKNDNPALLMEVARWWIETNKLDHFEKATKICLDASVVIYYHYETGLHIWSSCLWKTDDC